MKKIFHLILLPIFCLTTPLLAQQAPPIDNSDTESPTDLSSPAYAPTHDAPFRTREDLPPSLLKKHKKTAAVVLGTLAAVTIGLIVSGADTGKHIPPKESSTSR
ncbi:MAG: hypothetical protein AB7N99_09220 [Simkaniaceae bacterium]|jgi:hypothetical protein